MKYRLSATVCLFTLIALSSATARSEEVKSEKKTKEDAAVLYTYSEAVVQDGKASVSQLSISSGEDGKYHYTRNENGTVESGIWKGEIPKVPDVTKMLSESVSNITKELSVPLKSLTDGIGSSIQKYLQNAFGFLR